MGSYARALKPLQSLPICGAVTVRVPDERDISLVLNASTDPSITSITSMEPDSTAEQARAFIDRQINRPAQRQGWSLTIVELGSDTPVGNLFVSCRSLDLGCIEIGYWVAPAFRRQGYAAAALALARDWVPAEFEVDRLTLFIDPDNAGSLATAAHAGFTNEQTMDCWERIDDEFRTMTMWGIGPDNERAQLGTLEYRMWLPGYRGDVRWFEHHLAPEFVEHGCSGRLWTRADITAQVMGDIEVDLPLRNLELARLDEHSWMLTYISVQPDRQCRRVSIWQSTASGWRMRFHQGTPIPVSSGSASGIPAPQ